MTSKELKEDLERAFEEYFGGKEAELIDLETVVEFARRFISISKDRFPAFKKKGGENSE